MSGYVVKELKTSKTATINFHEVETFLRKKCKFEMAFKNYPSDLNLQELNLKKNIYIFQIFLIAVQ